MLSPIKKMKKVSDTILKILLQDVVVLIVSCNMLCTFLGLSCILKVLRTWLKNEDIP